MKRLWLVLALVLATGVGLSATAVAQAKKGHGHHATAAKKKGHGTVHGVVSAVDTTGGTITLTVRKTCESATISVTADTKIRVNGKEGALADIQVGYHAKVKLAKDDTAKRIHARAAHARHVLHGSVTEVGTDSITLQLKKTCEVVTVPVTSETKIRVNGKKGALSDIQVGYRALVKLAKDGTAKRVHARAPKS